MKSHISESWNRTKRHHSAWGNKAGTQPGEIVIENSSHGGYGVGSISGTSSSSATQAMSFTYTDLTPGVTYNCVIESQCSDGSPAGFTQKDVTTQGAVVPNTPTTLPNSIYSLNATYVTGQTPQTTGVLVVWADDSNNESGFEIQRSTNGTFSNANGDTTENFYTAIDAGNYLDTTAGPDSIYYYRVTAMGNASGLYNSAPTSVATVNTPGVSITIDTTQLDPAFNPEIWVDESAMNYSTGTIDPPTSGDTNVVPVTVNVPLGADDYGTATLTWNASIRLYNSSMGQVGTLSNGFYSYSWNVSSSSSNQTFAAQAITVSQQLGDKSFTLAAALQFYSDAAIATQPALPQTSTSPAAKTLATDAEFAIITNRDNFLTTPEPHDEPVRYAIVGQLIQAEVKLGPAAAFPSDPKITWDVGGLTVFNEVYTALKGTVIPSTFPDQLSIANVLSFYWYGDTDAVHTIRAEAAGYYRTVDLAVFGPTSQFVLKPNKNKPPFVIVTGGDDFVRIAYEVSDAVSGIGSIGTITGPNPNVNQPLSGLVTMLQLVKFHSTVVSQLAGTDEYPDLKTWISGSDVGDDDVPSQPGYLDDSLGSAWNYEDSFAVPNVSTAVPPNPQPNPFFEDSPDVFGSEAVSIASAFSAMDYIMYKPSSSLFTSRLSNSANLPEAIWVPLSTASWGFTYTFSRPPSGVPNQATLKDPNYFTYTAPQGEDIPFSGRSIKPPEWLDNASRHTFVRGNAN